MPDTNDPLGSALRYNADRNRNLLAFPWKYGSSAGTPSNAPRAGSAFVLGNSPGSESYPFPMGEGGGRQSPAGQPPGYGGFNQGMGNLASLAGFAAGGFPGLAMSLAGIGLKYGMGRVAPESLAFTPNLLGAYGFNTSTPEEAALAQAVLGAMSPEERSDMELGAIGQANTPFSTGWQGIFGGPKAPQTLAQLIETARAYGVNLGTVGMSPGAAWDAMGRPAYNMGEQPSLPGPPTASWASSYPPGAWTSSSTPPGTRGPGDQEDVDIGAAAAANAAAAAQDTGGFGSADTSSDPDAGSGGGPGGDWARGGVSRVRQATRARYGEAGPETAIFVPEAMYRAGIQGREQAVREALLEEIRRLGRRKGQGGA